ncbi:hypothetical protein GJ496_012000 [Pomphorhynchus laevis]|nr:hypothetical protein GJ496_012000 [Pomphorhynchus laevis]
MKGVYLNGDKKDGLANSNAVRVRIRHGSQTIVSIRDNHTFINLESSSLSVWRLLQVIEATECGVFMDVVPDTMCASLPLFRSNIHSIVPQWYGVCLASLSNNLMVLHPVVNWLSFGFRSVVVWLSFRCT